MKNPTLGLFMLSYKEKELTLELVNSMSSIVDEVVVGIDDRNCDGTGHALTAMGHRYYVFNLDKLGFAEGRNKGLDMMKSDWILCLAPDERVLPEDFKHILYAMKRGMKEDIDGFSLPRRHWRDLEMTNEWGYPYPDRHVKLFRNINRIRYTGLVHEQLQGLHKVEQLKFDVHHFNLYYDSKKPFGRREKEELYDGFLERQKVNMKNIAKQNAKKK